MDTFVTRLLAELEYFRLESALELSDTIHEFEASGGELTQFEDDLWMLLTIKIEEMK